MNCMRFTHSGVGNAVIWCAHGRTLAINVRISLRSINVTIGAVARRHIRLCISEWRPPNDTAKLKQFESIRQQICDLWSVICDILGKMQVAQPNRYEKIDFLGEGQVSAIASVEIDLHCEIGWKPMQSHCARHPIQLVSIFSFTVCDGVQGARHSYRCHRCGEENQNWFARRGTRRHQSNGFARNQIAARIAARECHRLAGCVWP